MHAFITMHTNVVRYTVQSPLVACCCNEDCMATVHARYMEENRLL